MSQAALCAVAAGAAKTPFHLVCFHKHVPGARPGSQHMVVEAVDKRILNSYVIRNNCSRNISELLPKYRSFVDIYQLLLLKSFVQILICTDQCTYCPFDMKRRVLYWGEAHVMFY